MHLFISNYSSKFETGTVIMFIYTNGSRDGYSVAFSTVIPSDTVISMRLPDSASIFTAEVWAVIKTLEIIKDSDASRFIKIFKTHFRILAL